MPILNDVDRRMPVKDTIVAKNPLIQCIGQLKIDFNRKVFGMKKQIQTGTVIHVNQNNEAFVLACANSVIFRLGHCKKCDKIVCGRCNCGNKPERKAITADDITFCRRDIDGLIAKQYVCKVEYVHYKYYEYYSPKDGYDLVILKFKDTDNFYKHYTQHIQLESTQKTPNVDNIWMFGFPMDKVRNFNVQCLWGMQCTVNKVEIKLNDKTHKKYLAQYAIDSYQGQSGSPYFYLDPTSPKTVIIAVHSGGQIRLRCGVAQLLNFDEYGMLKQFEDQKKNVIAQNMDCKDDEKSAGVKVINYKPNEPKINCSYFSIANALIKQEFPEISSKSFNEGGNMCYCDKCHKKRGDKIVYSRGDPRKIYTLPVGWSRLGLKIDDAFCETHKVWKKWHVAFHGTQKTTVPLIFKGRLILLKAGDVAVGGAELGICDGHIPKPHQRMNLYTKKEELFDPNQIYLSQSIKYSGCEVYAKYSECNHPTQKNKKIKAKFAFQVRIRPGSYGIGQETIGASRKKQIIDENFNNNELEWYTKENVGIVVYGLLVKFEET
eukprot:244079_1